MSVPAAPRCAAIGSLLAEPTCRNCHSPHPQMVAAALHGYQSSQPGVEAGASMMRLRGHLKVTLRSVRPPPSGIRYESAGGQVHQLIQNF